MAWTPRPGTFHYGRTEADYKHLIELHQKYKLKTPPIEELKEAALADGYPPEKVAKFKYVDMSHIDVNRLLKPNKYKKVELEPEPEVDEDDDDTINNDENKFDVDEFCSDNEEPEAEVCYSDDDD